MGAGDVTAGVPRVGCTFQLLKCVFHGCLNIIISHSNSSCTDHNHKFVKSAYIVGLRVHKEP